MALENMTIPRAASRSVATNVLGVTEIDTDTWQKACVWTCFFLGVSKTTDPQLRVEMHTTFDGAMGPPATTSSNFPLGSRFMNVGRTFMRI